jgi:hypothetical protein
MLHENTSDSQKSCMTTSTHILDKAALQDNNPMTIVVRKHHNISYFFYVLGWVQ